MTIIKSIEITGSPFFIDSKMELSPNLNCIMGGRGTGKTTILSFIKSTIYENSESENNISKILKSNLGTGKIVIEIQSSDNITYRIEKSFNDTPQPYSMPDLEYVEIEKILQSIECDIYEAGKIEEIGRSSLDRLNLIDKKIKIQILDCESRIEKIQIDLDSNAQDIKTENRRIAQFDTLLEQYVGIDKEFEAHKEKQVGGFTEDERKEFEAADAKEKVRKLEKRFLSKTIDSLVDIRNFNSRRKEEFVEHQAELSEDANLYYNKNIINKAIQTANEAKEEVIKSYESLDRNLLKFQEKISLMSGELGKLHESQQAEFIKLKLKYESSKEYINKYQELSKKLNERDTVAKDKKEHQKKIKKIKKERAELLKKFGELKTEIYHARLEIVNELNKEFGKDIVITLTYGGITDDFQEHLKSALRGSRMRYNELVPRIAESFGNTKFAEIIHKKDAESLKSIPQIDQARAEALIDTLYETDEIYAIESLYCQDYPEFLLKVADDSDTKEDNYRSTDELSMGQRCTTILPIVFAVSNNPLLIDQPEDNLDNKYIAQSIHKLIRRQKSDRQLVFITHNPNIPVLSDAEKNIFLKYENRTAEIEASGKIDEVKDRIVNLLEGGEEAFRRRSEIYGLDK
ncbi:AAA family ATPase [Leptospira dzoumogneensis]|uniref:Rad50/SbcC-type AAA domain-containing protein n=1 Tax=Leptospira dzoumogneensis TaxID=2484904 RepID=A0A4Z1AUW2_9LEPT|nr:AAA family ATPase [Leptospira dzoumogneensis]TGN00012.1 hypothetical protein EHR06_07780 [Leptospira dzoumogneensis]